MTINYQTGEITEPLTAMERSALVHAEATIERGLTSFIEVGEALSEVRDSKLYREEFGTFETYCRDRWSITDRRARQMIDAATIATSLPTGTTVPVNEGQARQLVGLAPEQAAEVMGRAIEATAGNVTAAAIRDARAPLTKPEAEEFRAAVVGIDGKTYTRPTPAPKPVLNGNAAEYANAEQAAKALSRAVAKLLEFEHPNMRAGMRRYWDMASIEVPPAQRADVTPEQMRVAAHGLLALADEWNR